MEEMVVVKETVEEPLAVVVMAIVSVWQKRGDHSWLTITRVNQELQILTLRVTIINNNSFLQRLAKNYDG